MLIKRLQIRNWRNFRNVDVVLGDRVFLVGPNASGKSNFLDLFRFLRDIVRPGGLQKAITERGGISKIRCLAARKDPVISVGLDLVDGDVVWKYELGLKQQSRGNRLTLVSFERVQKNGDQVLNRPDKDDEEDEIRLTQTHLEQVNSNKEFRDLADFFSSTVYLHLVPQILRFPEAFSGPEMTGDPFGREFLSRIAATPEKIRRSRLKKIEEALRLAVPQLKSLIDVKDERGAPHLEAVYEHWRPQGARQREDQFSDGTLRLLGLLWSLLEGDSLLLLEEPELSLHAGIVRKLAPLIHRLQKIKRRQIILSTHSADLLSDPGIGPEEVLLLHPSTEGTEIRTADSDRTIRTLLGSGLSLADVILPMTEPSADSLRQLDLFEG